MCPKTLPRGNVQEVMGGGAFVVQKPLLVEIREPRPFVMASAFFGTRADLKAPPKGTTKQEESSTFWG